MGAEGEVEVEVQRSDRVERDANSGEPSFLVCVWDSVVEQLHRYALQDTSRERAGVLMGSRTPRGVDVNYWIEARHAGATKTSVTFTHETWRYINEVRDRDLRGVQMVGWFHTHPGFGLFLSEQDRFIHKNFFDQPYQVACVLDPVRQEMAFFHWEGAELREAARHHIRTKSGELVSHRTYTYEQTRPVSPLPQLPLSKLAGLVLGGSVLSAVLTSWLLLPRQLARIEGQLPALHQQVALSREETSGAAQNVAQLSLLVQDLRSQVAELRETNGQGSPRVTHVVRRGESLWTLANWYLGDGRLWRVLMEYNGLNNELVVPGQVISIPVTR
ncbi:MAG TPA: Mov34/MPN/PAD-1 family protein [Bacillota bacterium]|nr:Mov34/MPN/PAD-1 family protein [Bacillota bacterium]